MTNYKLLNRICQLIAMNRALSIETVWEVFEQTGSIDKVLELTEKM